MLTRRVGTLCPPPPWHSTEQSYKRPPIYKLFLHNDNYNKREYVVKVLLKIVDTITIDDAVVVMQVGRLAAAACPGLPLQRCCSAAHAFLQCLRTAATAQMPVQSCCGKGGGAR